MVCLPERWRKRGVDGYKTRSPEWVQFDLFGFVSHPSGGDFYAWVMETWNGRLHSRNSL